MPACLDVGALLQAGTGPPDPSLLVSTEMLRMIREMRSEDKRRRGVGGEDLFLDEAKAATSLGKAVAGMHRHCERLRTRPKAIIDQFREECQD